MSETMKYEYQVSPKSVFEIKEFYSTGNTGGSRIVAWAETEQDAEEMIEALKKFRGEQSDA